MNDYKNFMGHLKGYSGCPNCGDTWDWKPHNNPGIRINEHSSMMLCDECYAIKNALDKDAIMASLSGKTGSDPWPEEMIQAVMNALEEQ